MAATDPSTLLDRLAGLEPTPFPFISLYLNAQANERGRDSHETFVRTELGERAASYIDNADARASLTRDLDRIQAWVATELQPSANGAAIFACSAAGVFEAIQVAAAIDENLLFIGDRPHLYPLARLDARYPRYAALVCDTNHARIFVFATGAVEKVDEVQNEKTRRHDMGGWSQARFQRRIDNQHKAHIQDAVDALDRIVRAEAIEHVLVTGNDVSLPIIEECLPQPLRDRVVDMLHLDTKAPESDVLERTLEAMHRKDAESDQEKVEALMNAYRSGGLGVVGFDRTRRALEHGQVDELVVSASLVQLEGVHGIEPALAEADDRGNPESIEKVDAALKADGLVAIARRTDATITFIEDPTLLARVGGVGALLRYKV
jgi:peptide subunit release factor 1 (eRF1)